MNSERRPVGIWVESPRGAQWAGQGMTRLLGFIIEGIAAAKSHVFRIVVTDEIRDEAEADFNELVAQNGVDFTFHSPRDVGEKGEFFEDLAMFANEHVTVDAWISLFPNQTGAQLLDFHQISVVSYVKLNYAIRTQSQSEANIMYTSF
jgi:hypothetical protein